MRFLLGLVALLNLAVGIKTWVTGYDLPLFIQIGNSFVIAFFFFVLYVGTKVEVKKK